jgi:threonine/homoserine/homoserine lactone efflux protein
VQHTAGVTQTYLAFGVAVYLLALAPGPSALLVVQQALSGGRRAALWTTAGNSVGLLVWSAAAAVGLAGLVATSQPAYVALRLVGAAVLVVLGVRTLLATRRGRRREDHPVGGPAPRSSAAAFRLGLLNNLGNPKVAVFALSLLPQFAPAGASPATYALLALEWAVLAASWYVVLALLVVRAGGVLQGGRLRRWAERVTGLTLVGLGAGIAARPTG